MKPLYLLLIIILLTSAICSHDLNNVWIESTVISVSYQTTSTAYSLVTAYNLRVYTDYAWSWETVSFSEITSSSITSIETTYPASLSGWQIIDEGSISRPSNWTLSGSSVRQSSNIYSTPDNTTTIPKPGTMALSPIAGKSIISGKMKNSDDDGFGIIFSYIDPSTYLRLSIDNQRGYMRIDEVYNGEWTNHWQTNPPTKNSIVSWKISDGGSVVVNDTVFFQFQPIELNKFGYYCWGSQNAYFYDLKSFTTATIYSIGTSYGMASVQHPVSYDTTLFYPYNDPPNLSIEVLGVDTINTWNEIPVTYKRDTRFKYIYKFDSQGQWVLEEVWRRVE